MQFENQRIMASMQKHIDRLLEQIREGESLPGGLIH